MNFLYIIRIIKKNYEIYEWQISNFKTIMSIKS